MGLTGVASSCNELMLGCPQVLPESPQAHLGRETQGFGKVIINLV